VVLTPRWVPNLRVSADWVDIKLEDAISSASGTSVLNACYDDPNYPNNDFCDRIRRDFSVDPTSPAFGQVAFITTSFVNQAELRYKGLLGALDYRVDTPFLGANSRVGVNLSYQYLDTLTTRATPGATPSRTHGTIGYPRHSAVLNVNYENGPALIFASFNYTGPVDQFANEPENFREFPRLNDNLFVNAGVAFSVSDRMRFRFIVDNLFDADPPFPVPAAGGSVTYFPGILGRYYRFGASFSF